MSRRQRGSDVMSAGPSVPVRRSGGRTPSAGRRSPGRRSPARRSPGSQGDRDTLAEKLNEMSRRKQEAQKMLRAAEDELTLAKSRLQRAETEGRQKDKTIDELLNANAGGVTDSSSLRRTQQQHTGALKARVGELETMLLEKEAALQQATNQPEAQTLSEVEAERRVLMGEVRRLQKLVGADDAGGGGGAAAGSGGVGTEAEWRQLKDEVGALRMAQAELTEQLQWASTDRDEALESLRKAQEELAAQRTELREGRSKLARLQVEKDQQARELAQLRESVR